MKRILQKIALLLLEIFVICFVVGLTIITYFSFQLPKMSTLNNYRPALPSQILSEDGTVLATFGQKRDLVELSDVPQVIVDAFLSAEDDRFYEHKGIDYIGIFRALIADLKAGKIVQGGSTITQQVAKTLLLSNERSFIRKIKDFLLAIKIERELSKDEILFLYLNQVYLGGGYYGVKAAFKGYFNKELHEATIAESAMLAGLLVAPGKYSPLQNPRFAIQRQRYVLNRMLSNGKIDLDEHDKAVAEEIRYRVVKKSVFKAGYFTDWVRQDVSDIVPKDKFLVDGFNVTTTLNWKLQQVAEKVINVGVKRLDKRQGFAGPLFNKDTEDIEQFILDERNNIYTENSNYFTIDENYNQVMELHLTFEENTWLQENRENAQSKLTSKKLIVGNMDDDPLFKIINNGQNYQGIVIALDNDARIIYVSIGGVIGIIPQKEYAWAHPRILSDEEQFFKVVTYPHEIVKVGDVILVKVLNKKALLWNYVANEFKNKFMGSPDYKIISNERYILCQLDQEPEVQASLTAIQPQTGKIISLVGGYDFEKSQFNRAIQSKRQPGSSFKPIVFAAALEKGFHAASIIIDSPEAMGTGDINWKPHNYDNRFKGPITLRKVIEESRNVPAVRVADKIGIDFIHRFAKRIKLNAELPPDLSLALGSLAISPLDLVSTYALFPNQGKLVFPKTIITIKDRDQMVYPINQNVRGYHLDYDQNEYLDEESPFTSELNSEQVYDPRLAYIMTNLLQGVVKNGTARGVRDLGQFIAGKTGTTNSYLDAWFIGFTYDVVVGVWVGFDDNKNLGWGETGSRAPLPIWKEYMDAYLKEFPSKDFPKPSGIVHMLINSETGKPATTYTTKTIMEAFIEESLPKEDTVDADINDGPILEDDDYYNF
jgi:penicillin-binding protein 1A